MDGEHLSRHFARMGARIKLDLPRRPRWGELPRPLAVDVRSDNRGEYFEVRRDPGAVVLDVLDVQPTQRHLLLMARLDAGRKDKFVCGHDERAWFAAAVPNAPGVSNVRTALEALRPTAVQAAALRRGLGGNGVFRRRTVAYVRQGEWFFVPAPELRPAALLVLRHEPLSRGMGKPHWADELVRMGGQRVYVRRGEILAEEKYRDLVARAPKVAAMGWRLMLRDAEVYVRGRIRHADHATIVLDGWHRVIVNREAEAPAARHLVFLD